MNKNIENIDRYLKGVALPEYISHQHRQQLRQEVLEEIERRQTMSVRKRSWKVAAVIALVIGAGAISVVGVNIGRYYYYGRNDAGDYIFVSEDRQSVDTLGADEVTDVEQTRRDLEEIELLRQQDKRQLIGVDELLANGKLERRVFTYQYQLSDGRTRNMREADELNFVLNQKQRQECIQFWHAGSGEELGTYEKKFKGRLFVFKQKKFVLSDGTEIISSDGMPKEEQ
jgi:hypothetical protein